MNRYALVALALLVPTMLHAEQISGKACYRYSDNEALNVARDIAFSMAKRDALESYLVFVESTTTVDNATLKNDLISSIGAGLLRNVQITQESEDLEKREICRAISAEVEPVEIKQQIVAKINVYRRQKAEVQTGLPESTNWKTLKMRTVQPNFGKCYKHNGRCLEVTAQCKSSFLNYGNGARITWFDEDGIPDQTVTDDRGCSAMNDILKFYLPLPPPNFTFSVDYTY